MFKLRGQYRYGASIDRQFLKCVRLFQVLFWIRWGSEQVLDALVNFRDQFAIGIIGDKATLKSGVKPSPLSLDRFPPRRQNQIVFQLRKLYKQRLHFVIKALLLVKV